MSNSKCSLSFQKAWLKMPIFDKWLAEVKTDDKKAYCEICKCELRAHKTDLIKHSTSLKHNRKSKQIPSQSNIKKEFQNINKVNQLELKFAVFIVCHTSMQSTDHLNEIFNKNLASSSTHETLRLLRTKCTTLIRKVISPELLKEQVAELNKSSFSLILDESTDISCSKHLCLCVRYYNEKENKISSQFLGLVEVEETTPDALYKNVKDFFNGTGIKLENCFAVITDGASNLCEVKHSLFTLMKQDIPNLLLAKCVCHSLLLICYHAYKELPSNLDYMIRETHNWFKRSALRKKSYMDIYKTINDGKDPLQLISLSSNRWLARSQCIKKILDQWESLQLHFELASSTCDKYLATELHNMYSEPSNKLYLTFVMPILSDFEKIDLLFQSEHGDHCKLLKELEQFTFSMLRRIIFPQNVSLDVDMNFSSIYLPIEKVDFGYSFVALMANKAREISVETQNIINKRCHEFLKSACKQLLQRIPPNYALLKRIENISPSKCLSHIRPPFGDLPLELADQSKLKEIESQWGVLLSIKWNGIFPSGIPNDDALFWSRALRFKNPLGNPLLQDLSKFALKLYSLPISNATVERVLSRVSSIKLQNRMCLELLDSILRIKMTLEEKNICCVNFVPSPNMLSYNSNIYEEQEGGAEKSTTD